VARLINLANLQQLTAVNLLSDLGDLGGPVVVPQCTQVVLNWTMSDSKVGHNVLYGRYSGAFAGTVAMADAIKTALTSGGAWSAMAGHMTVNNALASVSLRDVNTPNQAIITSTGAASAGTGTGTLLPDEVAICVTLRTALTGIQNRGRMFLPGFDHLSVGPGNTIGATTVTAVNNWAATITGALSGQGLVWVIGHKHRQAYTGVTGTQHPDRPAGSVPITSAVVRDNHWDTQRRRGLR
jgi:hypothetical protein